MSESPPCKIRLISPATGQKLKGNEVNKLRTLSKEQLLCVSVCDRPITFQEAEAARKEAEAALKAEAAEAARKEAEAALKAEEAEEAEEAEAARKAEAAELVKAVETARKEEAYETIRKAEERLQQPIDLEIKEKLTSCIKARSETRDRWNRRLLTYDSKYYQMMEDIRDHFGGIRQYDMKMLLWKEHSLRLSTDLEYCQQQEGELTDKEIEKKRKKNRKNNERIKRQRDRAKNEEPSLNECQLHCQVCQENMGREQLLNEENLMWEQLLRDHMGRLSDPVYDAQLWQKNHDDVQKLLQHFLQNIRKYKSQLSQDLQQMIEQKKKFMLKKNRDDLKQFHIKVCEYQVQFYQNRQWLIEEKDKMILLLLHKRWEDLEQFRTKVSKYPDQVQRNVREEDMLREHWLYEEKTEMNQLMLQKAREDVKPLLKQLLKQCWRQRWNNICDEDMEWQRLLLNILEEEKRLLQKADEDAARLMQLPNILAKFNNAMQPVVHPEDECLSHEDQNTMTMICELLEPFC